MIGRPFLDAAEKASLAARIAEAERRTRGEIVTVIAAESDGYRYIPLLWAALISLSVPGLYFLWESLTVPDWSYPGVTGVASDAGSGLDALASIYPVQALVFLGLGMLLQIPALRLRLIPASVKHERAARHAREQFFLQGLHRTELRSGILVFVSVAEHYIEIIADVGVADRVDDAVWTEIIEGATALLRRGRVAEGFELAIERCREVLQEHFPATDGRPDELPNHLIEV